MKASSISVLPSRRGPRPRCFRISTAAASAPASRRRAGRSEPCLPNGEAPAPAVPPTPSAALRVRRLRGLELAPVAPAAPQLAAMPRDALSIVSTTRGAAMPESVGFRPGLRAESLGA